MSAAVTARPPPREWPGQHQLVSEGGPSQFAEPTGEHVLLRMQSGSLVQIRLPALPAPLAGTREGENVPALLIAVQRRGQSAARIPERVVRYPGGVQLRGGETGEAVDPGGRPRQVHIGRQFRQRRVGRPWLPGPHLRRKGFPRTRTLDAVTEMTGARIGVPPIGIGQQPIGVGQLLLRPAKLSGHRVHSSRQREPGLFDGAGRPPGEPAEQLRRRRQRHLPPRTDRRTPYPSNRSDNSGTGTVGRKPGRRTGEVSSVTLIIDRQSG